MRARSHPETPASRWQVLRAPLAALTQEVIGRGHAVGSHTWDHADMRRPWDVDPQDWNRPGVASIVSNVVGNARPGAVSLMHDGGGNSWQSVAALAQILPGLKAKGYQFASLPGC